MSRLTINEEMDIGGLLKAAVEQCSSDIHFTVGAPPLFRIDGNLTMTDKRILDEHDTESIFQWLTTKEQQAQFKAAGEVDFSYILPGSGQFRGNAFLCRGKIAVALRVLIERIPTLAELGHAEILAELSLKPRGLIIVSGPTGSGKSTTVAAMIELINKAKACHIITLEEPIEYIHRYDKSIVHQREINTDTASFALGLRSALREDPDVIFVGELRDAETTAVALQAALTGHLVLATLHTSDTIQAIERMINVFPASQQAQVKLQLAMVVQGIVSQQLIKRKSGVGRVVAAEIMVATPAVRNLIREGKTHQLLSCLQTGSKFGMQTMDMALKHLWQKNSITKEDAVNYSFGQESF